MLLDNLSAVYKRMSHAALRSDRNPGDVRLVAVTKTVGVRTIRAAIDLGLRVFGESRTQEALRKIASPQLQVPGSPVEWHMIGHLQRNKAKDAVRLFALIHTVDSEALAEELNRQAEKAGKVQRILLQVKLSEEASKTGIGEPGLPRLLDCAASLPFLSSEGLMTIPPYCERQEDARPYFRRLREIRDLLRRDGLELRELSMGMSHDFEVAVEEGATLVRVGTSIFGERTDDPEEDSALN